MCFVLDQNKRSTNQSHPEPLLLLSLTWGRDKWTREQTLNQGLHISRLYMSQNPCGYWSWHFCSRPCKSTLLTTFHRHPKIGFPDHQQKSYLSKKRDKSFWGRDFWASQEVTRKWDIHCIACNLVGSFLKSSKHHCFGDHAKNGLGKM